MPTSQSEIIRRLLDPRTYPHPVARIERYETHISQVFVAGDYAYKLKKSVSLGFLDYSTATKRRHFAEAEIRLNRRLAPALYLDVLSVRDCGGNVEIDWEGNREGREVDCLVRMRRLPPQSLLADRLREGKATRQHLDLLLDQLLPFYGTATRPDINSQFGTPETLRNTLESNFKLTEGVVGQLVSPVRYLTIRSRQLSFLSRRVERFVERLREGHIRDVHGDLRAEHVAFVPECIVVDCVEFNDSYRIIDIAADLAFLVMDLEFLGAPELGEHLMERYSTLSGDSSIGGVLDFYVSYRAFVRAKVDSIKLAEPSTARDQVRRLTRRAKRYFELSYFHTLLLDHPLLLSVGGIPGSGKSTVAGAIAQELGASMLRSDVLRKKLAGLDPLARTDSGLDNGMYSAEHTAKVYRVLMDKARVLLNAGATVVLDATWSKAVDRQTLTALAQETGTQHVHFECQIDRELARRRLEKRAAAGVDPSDATANVHQELAGRYEPCAKGEAFVLDTSDSPEEVLEKALTKLRMEA